MKTIYLVIISLSCAYTICMTPASANEVAEQILFDANTDGTRAISRSDESTMLARAYVLKKMQKWTNDGDN